MLKTSQNVACAFLKHPPKGTFDSRSLAMVTDGLWNESEVSTGFQQTGAEFVIFSSRQRRVESRDVAETSRLHRKVSAEQVGEFETMIWPAHCQEPIFPPRSNSYCQQIGGTVQSNRQIANCHCVIVIE